MIHNREKEIFLESAARSEISIVAIVAIQKSLMIVAEKVKRAFTSERNLIMKARQVNEYLRLWGAVKYTASAQ